MYKLLEIYVSSQEILNMERIIQEKISADHLLYVSLKYTKTADVILNLIARWRSLFEMSFDGMLERAKKKKLLKVMPMVPKKKVDEMKILFRKEPEMIKAIELYEFFAAIDKLEKIRENEFRKNICLKVLYRGNWIEINMDKLKEYRDILERFISGVKQFIMV
jgi:pyoverdine/dityrosine biosynthesis protein Dit1